MFPNYRIIPATALDTTKHEVVAFRLSADDFHFMVRKGNGRWYHKAGATEINYISKQVLFANWYGLNRRWQYSPYGTDIIFFEKVR